MTDLSQLGEHIYSIFEAKNTLRDKAISLSRVLIRACANTIRAIHRDEGDDIKGKLAEIKKIAREMRDILNDHPDLYYAGYTQDALKEYVEAHLVYAIIRHNPIPTLEDLGVIESTYLNGMAEAATELRRRILDVIRQSKHDEAEYLLDVMDEIFTLLMTMDFSDALTGGLRRRADVLRTVLNKTRGDVTLSLRQQSLEEALEDMATRLNITDADALEGKGL